MASWSDFPYIQSDSEYATDTVSVTSTTPSGSEQDYWVDAILAERCEHGATRYLIKWKDYHLYSSTWEPEESCNGTELVDRWEKKKEHLGHSAWEDFNQNQTRRWEVAREKRAAKRLKHRRRVASQANTNGDSSDDDVPLVPRRRSAANLFKVENVSAKNNPSSKAHQRPHQTTLVEPRESNSNGAGREDSTIEELSTVPPHRSSSVPKRRVCDAFSKKVYPCRSPSPREVPTQPGRYTRTREVSTAALQREATMAANTSVPRAAKHEPAPILSQAYPPRVSYAQTQPKPVAIRRSGPIRFVNERITTRSEWGLSNQKEKHFKTLKFRYNAEKRGKHEAAPDVTALQFVNDPRATVSKQEGMEKRNSRQTEDVYSRRESGRGRFQEASPIEKPVTTLLDPPDWQKRKVPLTCFEWRNRSCERADEDCRFWHRDGFPMSPLNGMVPPKFQHKPKTCYYWLRRDEGCSSSTENCQFAHWNTGLLGHTDRENESIDLAERPRSLKWDSGHDHSHAQSTGTQPLHHIPSKMKICYYWARGKCHHKEANCRFAHRDTGVMSLAPGERRKSRTSEWEKPREAQEHDAPNDSPITEPDRTLLISSDIAETAVQNAADLAVVQAPTPSIDMMTTIGPSCKLDFAELFTRNEHILERRAFLLFHPIYHNEETDLITRWLLLHHVEVHNLWTEGTWDSYKQAIFSGGTGIIVAHPEFSYFEAIPEIGRVLRHEVNVWSIGRQAVDIYNHQSSSFKLNKLHECTEIFPIGGMIYITDEVFEQYPTHALRIIELFISKANRCRGVTGPVDSSKFVNDGCLLWRLATRPELMESIFEAYEKYDATVDEADPAQVSRLKLYALLHRTGFVEHAVSDEPYMPRPDDFFPIMSERGKFMEPYFDAFQCSQEEANYAMIELYAQLMIDLRREYRQFFVVHTEPHKVNWQSRLQHIDEIMTPEQCIKCLEAPARGNRFDFYEWAFPKKETIKGHE